MFAQNFSAMKTIKSIIQANRGLVSVTLLFFFLYAGLFRTSVINLSLGTKSEVAYKKSAATFAAEFTQSDDNDDSQNLPAQYKKVDNDLDDVEAILNDDFSFRNAVALFQNHDFFSFETFQAVSKLPLYDLFCNWKFHLL